MSTLLFAGAVNGSPEYQSQVLRHGVSPLMGRAPSGRLFGAISGVRDGVDQSIITVTPTQWTVAAHPGVIDTASQVDQGAYSYDFSGQTGALAAADATNARVDRLDMQFVQGDGTTTSDAVQAVYTVGVAASIPAAPTAPDNSFPLCTISVPKSGGGAPTFTWTAPTAFGVPSWKNLYIPAGSQPNSFGATPQYKLHPSGKVELQGILAKSSGTWPFGSAGIYAGTWNAEILPSHQLEFSVAITAGSTSSCTARLEIATNGNVTLITSGSGTGPSWFSFDGLSYYK